jgi:hypothetical protein
MWDQVTVPFARMLSSKLYPSLFGNKDYEEFLGLSGIRPPYPANASSLTPAQQERLLQNAHLRANLLSLELDGLQALKTAKATTVEITGPSPIYRLCNSQVTGSEFRFFWFTEDLLMRSMHEGGTSKKMRLQWLREHLAVSYNWSRCDRLARMRLKKTDALLAVKADGLPMRGVEIRPTDRSVRLPGDYFTNHKKYSTILPGGDPQLFLYLLPKDGIELFW